MIMRNGRPHDGFPRRPGHEREEPAEFSTVAKFATVRMESGRDVKIMSDI
jgi:hypothetical protein